MGSAAPPSSIRGRSIWTRLGARASSSAALKAAANEGVADHQGDLHTVYGDQEFGRDGPWRAMHAVTWDQSCLGLGPGRKLQLPLGLLFW
jgi:hypothetical protein